MTGKWRVVGVSRDPQVVRGMWQAGYIDRDHSNGMYPGDLAVIHSQEFRPGQEAAVRTTEATFRLAGLLEVRVEQYVGWVELAPEQWP